MPENQKFQRQIAYKLRIADILEGQFTKDDISAGYIKLNGINISRVNVICTLVYKQEQTGSYSSAVIDDGTGRISMRSFESDAFSKVDVGDILLVIGRIREFNNEKYIIPEIAKKIESIEWLNLRRLELKNFEVAKTEENKKTEIAEEQNTGIVDEVYSLIRKLDNGEGVAIEEVIKNSSNSKAEQIINRLLENGDVFEVKPGKLKILE